MIQNPEPIFEVQNSYYRTREQNLCSTLPLGTIMIGNTQERIGKWKWLAQLQKRTNNQEEIFKEIRSHFHQLNEQFQTLNLSLLIEIAKKTYSKHPKRKALKNPVRFATWIWIGYARQQGYIIPLNKFKKTYNFSITELTLLNQFFPVQKQNQTTQYINTMKLNLHSFIPDLVLFNQNLDEISSQIIFKSAKPEVRALMIVYESLLRLNVKIKPYQLYQHLHLSIYPSTFYDVVKKIEHYFFYKKYPNQVKICQPI